MSKNKDLVILPEEEATAFIPYQVKVEIDDLNIRTGPGMNHDRTGKFTGVGIFTIVEESTGEGATLWGKLESGVGWIDLDFCSVITPSAEEE